jgi:putative redox protein
VFTHIKIEYQVTGHGVEERAVRRAIELSARRYCPVQAMLGQVVPIELEYQIFEVSENEKRELATSGEIHLDR